MPRQEWNQQVDGLHFTLFTSLLLLSFPISFASYRVNRNCPKSKHVSLNRQLGSISVAFWNYSCRMLELGSEREYTNFGYRFLIDHRRSFSARNATQREHQINKVQTETIFHENISRLSTQIKFYLASINGFLLIMAVLASATPHIFRNKNYFLILLFKRVGEQKHTINRFTLRWFFVFIKILHWHFILCLLDHFYQRELEEAGGNSKSLKNPLHSFREAQYLFSSERIVYSSVQ